MADEATRKTVSEIPVLKTNSGPRDKELWVQRLREEYLALIKYVENNKAADNDWFRLESNKEGTRWFGKCWYIHELLKYEFDMEFDIPVTYPATAPEVAIPELDGKTAKMYRGGKICLTDHFKPLWARNVPKFGLAHLMALGVSYVTSKVKCIMSYISDKYFVALKILRFKSITNLCSFLSLDHGLQLRFQTSLQKA
uniref:Ubiquitin-fold modifier-conjugating enzyme 1 n=1 Tax=Cyprinus carpio TaxID=7962 RepID=A0A8C2APV5_CYPCA